MRFTASLLICFFILLNFSTYSQGRLKYSANSGASFYSMPAVTWKSTNIDSNKVEVVPIGFKFKYRNKEYTHIAVSPMGWISFDTTVTSVDSNSKLSNCMTPNLLAPMWDIHHIDPGKFGTQGKYGIGAGTDTVFLMNWSMYLGGNCVAFCNDFLLGLVKSSNKILFIYPTLHHSVQPTGLAAYIGIVGDTSASGNDYLSIDHSASSGVKNVWDSQERSTSKVPQNYQSGFYYEIIPCDGYIIGDTIIDSIGCVAYKSPSGKTILNAGTYKDTLVAPNNCDSIITIQLIQLSKLPARDTIVDTACTAYQLPGGRIVNFSGNYFDTLKTNYGCDSIIRFELKIHQVNGSTLDTIKISACDRIISPSRKYLWINSGFYTDTIVKANKYGCDSIFIVDLTIGQHTTKRDTVVYCDQYTWPRNNKKYTTTGVYFDSLKNQLGCDSVAVLHLTINKSYSHKKKINSCGPYNSPSGKYVWTRSGLYLDSLHTAYGCDSVLEIDLTINSSSTDTIKQIVCGQFMWNVTSAIYTKTGIYRDTLLRKNGCDSIKVLNLVVNPNAQNSISVRECDEYISPSGNYTWVKSGTYQDTLPSANGCDCVLTIAVDIYTSFRDTVTTQACDSFFWNQNGRTYLQSGSYSDKYTGANGCDSSYYLNLKINRQSFTVQKSTSCGSMLSPSTKKMWFESGVYLDTLSGDSGCYSVVEVHATILNPRSKISLSNDSLISIGDTGSYQWVLCEGSGLKKITNANSNWYSPKENGKYALITRQQICSDTSDCFDYVIGRMRVPFSDYELHVYPNPAKDNVVVSSDKSNIHKLKLYSSAGKIIYNVSTQNSKQVQVDLSTFENGAYYIEVKLNNGLRYMPLIITRQ